MNVDFVNSTEEDRQYLIHSRALNAYDAVVLWAVTWHAAVLKLLNSTNDSLPICQSIATPLKQSNAGLDIVSQTMTEILENNVYCGVSVSHSSHWAVTDALYRATIISIERMRVSLVRSKSRSFKVGICMYSEFIFNVLLHV